MPSVGAGNTPSMETMFRIAPPLPCLAIRRHAATDAKSGVRTLIAYIASKASSVASSSGPIDPGWSVMPPALLTRTSSDPSSRAAASTIFIAASVSARSSACTKDLRPTDRISSATCSSAERVFESPVTWHANGYLFLTGQPEIMTKLGEAAALQRSMGLNDVHVLDAEQIRETVPWIGTDGVLGGTYTPHDGKVTPTEGVAALVRAARSRGVSFREHWPVRALERDGRSWRIVGPDVLESERVVVCAGYWTTDLMRPLGLELTIRPMPLYAAITGPALTGQRVPLTIDLDSGLLIEREADGLLVAILLEENPPGYGHAQMLEDFADLARVRAPSLADLRI